MKKPLLLALSAFTTLLAVSFLTFVLMKLVPGGPFDSDRALPEEVLNALNEKFRLNLPWYEQYFAYMKDFFRGDLGPSIKYPGTQVIEIISDSFPVSLELGIYAMSIAVVVGLSLGIVAAVYRGGLLDYSSMFIAVSGISLPSFMVAAIFILLFSHGLGILPAALWDSPAHKIMPSIVLGLRPAAIIARFTRSSLLEVLSSDFVRTARAKGLRYSTVVAIHALKNSLLPVLTILGPMTASVLTGSFIVEHVFSVPGLATNYIQGVSNRDYPLIMGVTLLFASALIVTNLLVDLSYSLLDPRMKESQK